jgi:hypothetical protein
MIVKNAEAAKKHYLLRIEIMICRKLKKIWLITSCYVRIAPDILKMYFLL